MRIRSVFLAAVVVAGCGAEPSRSEDSAIVATTLQMPEATDGGITTSTSVLAPMSTMSSQPETSTVLFDFARDGVDEWFVQNDTVMGGVSSSTVTLVDGEMLFAGTLSLDNNGGFASVRGPRPGTGSVASGDALSIDARGDGRTYLVQILTPTDSYVARFVPTDGPVTVPFAEFTAVDWRLERVAAVAPLDAASIERIALYVLDKQVGEFEVRVRSIAVVES